MSENKMVLNDMPNDYLLHLFGNYLDFNSKIEAEKVCKQWYELIRLSFEGKRCLVISDYELHENRIQSLNLLERRISIVKMVSFHLIERTESKDKKYISMILRKYRNLETLCISLKFTKCNKFLELIIKYSSKGLKKIRLELSECSVNNRTLIVTHEEMVQLCEKLSQLKYFYLDFVILYLNEQSFHQIFTKWSNIETFILHTPCFRGCIYNSELENPSVSNEFIGEHFSEFPKSMVRLEVTGNIFNLHAINRIPDETNLKRLLVFKLNLNSIDVICRKFSSLIYFGFSVENNVNEDDIYHLMENIGKLQHLEEVYIAISSGVPINYNCIKFLHSCTRLRSLQFDQSMINKEAIDAITRYFPNIQTLEIWTSGLNQNFHHCLNDTTVVNIQKLKSLTKLNLRGQRNLSDNSIAAIVANCHQLVSIDIRTTKAAIITLKNLTERSHKSKQRIEVFIHETPICRLFSQELKRYEFLTNLLLSNEEYDYKIKF